MGKRKLGSGVLAGHLLGVALLLMALPNGYAKETPAAPWKFVFRVAPGSPTFEAFRDWGKALSERTKGRLAIELHGNEELNIAGPEQLKIIGRGVIKIGEVQGNYLMGEEPVLAISGLPFLGTTDKIVEKLNALQPYADAVFQKHNIKALAHFDIPNVLWTNVAVNTLADFKKLKLRSSSPSLARAVEKLGATAVTLPGSEVYQALATGIINCTTFSVVGGIFWGTPEVCKIVYLSPIFNGAAAWVVVNREAFNSLPADVQKVLVETSREFEPRFIQSVILTRENRPLYEPKIKKLRIEESLDPKMIDQIVRQVAIPSWDEWAGKRPAVKAAVDSVKAALGVAK